MKKNTFLVSLNLTLECLEFISLIKYKILDQTMQMFAECLDKHLQCAKSWLI